MFYKGLVEHDYEVVQSTQQIAHLKFS